MSSKDTVGAPTNAQLDAALDAYDRTPGNRWQRMHAAVAAAFSAPAAPVENSVDHYAPNAHPHPARPGAPVDDVDDGSHYAFCQEPARPGAEDAEPVAWQWTDKRDGTRRLMWAPPALGSASRHDARPLIYGGAPADAGAARVAELEAALRMAEARMAQTADDLHEQRLDGLSRRTRKWAADIRAALAAGQDAGERG